MQFIFARAVLQYMNPSGPAPLLFIVYIALWYNGNVRGMCNQA